VTAHQDADGLVSNFKQGPTDDDAKGNAFLLLIIPPHAATTYTSNYDSTLLRCHDEAEADLKALLWPLIAHTIEVASSSSDGLDAADLKYHRSSPRYQQKSIRVDEI